MSEPNVKTSNDASIMRAVPMKLGAKFIVRHPLFPTYIIKRVAIGLHELQLSCHVPKDMPILKFYDLSVADIFIEWLDETGIVIDAVSCKNCKVLEVVTVLDWYDDTLAEVVITYSIGALCV